jgi:hypothetical protein
MIIIHLSRIMLIPYSYNSIFLLRPQCTRQHSWNWNSTTKRATFCVLVIVTDKIPWSERIAESKRRWFDRTSGPVPKITRLDFSNAKELKKKWDHGGQIEPSGGKSEVRHLLSNRDSTTEAVAEWQRLNPSRCSTNGISNWEHDQRN